MRCISLWSLGTCTLCAALATAQTPRSDRGFDGRSFVPRDEKQSANVMTVRPGYRAFSEMSDARSLLAEPSVRRISADKSSKYQSVGDDLRSLGRDLRESTMTRNTSLLQPAAEEKRNIIPESTEIRRLTAPSSPRSFRPEQPPVKEGYLDRQSERR